ncbi:MAG: guanylate kinase [Saprospiraceae bacterium]|nr:guanylate kinase [Saprospiraceae bacterium]
MSTEPTEGKLIIFTAPSGSGKTTVVRHLLDAFDTLAFSVSATTRAKREHEQHGVDYYYLSQETFRMWIAEEAFVEWEEVYANQFYGTLKFEVERLWAQGKHVIFDIDVKGAMSIKKRYPDQSLAVFIKVPSLETLVERLRQRKTESEQSLQKRIQRIKEELTYEHSFDRVLINDDLEETLEEARRIVETFTGNTASAR